MTEAQGRGRAVGQRWQPTGIAFGGDYNPEQWPEQVHEEDVVLMREAGVDLVTVGVFSWALLEPSPGSYDFGWLDRVLDRLADHGLGVDLATATASPPPWLAHRHPEVLPRTADGTVLSTGGRQAFCPSSPTWREHALRLCTAMAERYAGHRALRMWHVGNELGCHNALCFCDTSAAAFRTWLEARYGTVEELNRAWGTAFWSQRYGSFEEVQPPRTVTATANPTQQLDFQRFSSDESLRNFTAERDVLHALSPGVPVTTNFMVTEHIRALDYHRWAREVDVVSNDHYVIAADPEGWRELAFCADLTRGLAGGGPWLLMEQSTSAVNWQPRNVAKQPGELLRNSVQHVARGADGVLFFQWRASRAGSEKFHAALVPHAGTDSRIWREVVELGSVLDRLDEVVGARTTNEVAVLFDWDAWWASELDSHPTVDHRYVDRAHATHRALADLGVGVDVVHPASDLSSYKVVVVPTLYCLSDETAASLEAFARGGGALLVTYFSAVTDLDDHVREGGYGAALAPVLGLRTEEWYPLRAGERVALSDGSGADVWTERVQLLADDVTVLATYVDGPVRGQPALTRRAVGDGSAWYCSTRLDQPDLDRLVAQVADAAGVTRLAPVPAGVEVTERTSPDGATRWLFVVNHTDADVPIDVAGHDLVADAAFGGTVPARGVAVVRR